MAGGSAPQFSPPLAAVFATGPYILYDVMTTVHLKIDEIVDEEAKREFCRDNKLDRGERFKMRPSSQNSALNDAHNSRRRVHNG